MVKIPKASVAYDYEVREKVLRNIEDILNVQGLESLTLEQLRDLIQVCGRGEIHNYSLWALMSKEVDNKVAKQEYLNSAFSVSPDILTNYSNYYPAVYPDYISNLAQSIQPLLQQYNFQTTVQVIIALKTLHYVDRELISHLRQSWMQNFEWKNPNDAIYAISAIQCQEFSNQEIIDQFKAQVGPTIHKFQIDDLSKIVYNLSSVQNAADQFVLDIHDEILGRKNQMKEYQRIPVLRAFQRFGSKLAAPFFIP